MRILDRKKTISHLQITHQFICLQISIVTNMVSCFYIIINFFSFLKILHLFLYSYPPPFFVFSPSLFLVKYNRFSFKLFDFYPFPRKYEINVCKPSFYPFSLEIEFKSSNHFHLVCGRVRDQSMCIVRSNEKSLSFS